MSLQFTMRRSLSHASVWVLAAAMAFGLSAMAAHAAEQPKAATPDADDSHYIISMQTVDFYGHPIQLAKYFSHGQLCQQYPASVSHSESPTHFSLDVQLSEICDVPESRKRPDGSDDLVPKKLVEMRDINSGGYTIQLPIVANGGAKK